MCLIAMSMIQEDAIFTPVSAHACLHGVRFTPVQFNTQDGEADLVEFKAIFNMNSWKSTAEEIEEGQAMNGSAKERTADVVVEH